MLLIMRFLTAATLITTHASASEWWYVDSSTGDDAYFVDVQSIIREPLQVTYWIESIYNELKAGVKSMKTRTRDTCVVGQRTSTDLYTITYALGGKVVRSVGGAPSSIPLAPDTVGLTVNKFVCSTAAERAKLGIKVADPAATAAALLEVNQPPK